MTTARCLDDHHARAVLALVGEAPRSGAELAASLTVSPGELALIAKPLWAAKLLQGEVADGCCRDPCGTACVSCRMDLVWSLSRKGVSTVKRCSYQPTEIGE